MGRYTHRAAISNNRIPETDGKTVRFMWKDYRDNNSCFLFGSFRLKHFTLDSSEKSYYDGAPFPNVFGLISDIGHPTSDFRLRAPVS